MPIPKAVRMLVDTGASHTCLDPAVFSELQLTPTGSIDVLTPSTGAVAVQADTYDVGLAIGSKPGDQPFYLNVESLPLPSSSMVKVFTDYLGRDILAKCLHYNGATAKSR